MNRPNRAFLCQFLLLYVPAKLLMVIPFHINWKTGRASASRVGAVIACFVGACYYAFHLYSAYHQMITQQDTNFVTTLIDSYNQYAGCSFLMIIIVNACSHQSHLVTTIETIRQVDNILSLDGGGGQGTTNKYMLRFHGPAYAFTTCICVMEYYFCIMFIKDTPTFSTYCLLMCYVPLLVHLTTELVFCALLCCITDRLYQLRKLRQTTTCSIRLIKRAFDSLRVAAELSNVSFRLPILLLTFHQFTAITTLTYDLAVAIVKYDYRAPGYNTEKIIVQLQSSGGWSLFFIAESFILCLVCDRFKSEYSRCGKWLQSILQPDNLNDSQQRWMQLQVVAQTTKPFAISACGLFEVDMQLLYNMIGIITTYLIILVQFDVAQRSTASTGPA